MNLVTRVYLYTEVNYFYLSAAVVCENLFTTVAAHV